MGVKQHFEETVFNPIDKLTGFESGAADSFWDPSDSSSIIPLWLDGSLIDRKTGGAQQYLTLSGANVTNWADRSGNAEDFANITGGNEPQLVTTNGQSVAFTLTDGLINNNTIATGGEYHFFFALRNILETTVARKTLIDIQTGRLICYFNRPNSATEKYGLFDSAERVAVAENTYDTQMLYMRHTDTTSTIERDANNVALVSSAASAVANLGGQKRLGCNFSSFSAGFEGEMIEIVAVEGPLGTTDKEKIEGYLAWKVSVQYSDTTIVDNLPSAHVYKDAPPMSNYILKNGIYRPSYKLAA